MAVKIYMYLNICVWVVNILNSVVYEVCLLLLSYVNKVWNVVWKQKLFLVGSESF